MNDHQLTITDNASVAPVANKSGSDFDNLWRAANAFAGSSMVPQHFQGKPQDCFVIIQLAFELGVAPLTALQNVYVINGRPSFSARFAVGLANRSRAFSGPIRWDVNPGDGKPESLSVTARAPLNDGEIAEVTITMAQAIKEGWTKNSKYKTIPEQMLRWRTAKWLIDLYCPEILFGFDVVDGDAAKRQKQQNVALEDKTHCDTVTDSLQQHLLAEENDVGQVIEAERNKGQVIETERNIKDAIST